MKGILLKLLEDHTRRNFGAEIWLDSSMSVGLDAFTWSTQDYPDDQLWRVGEKVRQAAGLPRRHFWAGVGLSVFPALSVHLPLALDSFASSDEFLLHLETVVHPAVGKMYSGAQPPRIRAELLEAGVLQLQYESGRGLCELTEGFVMATLSVFGDEGVVTQPECKLRGDAACVIRVVYEKGGIRGG